MPIWGGPAHAFKIQMILWHRKESDESENETCKNLIWFWWAFDDMIVFLITFLE